MALGAVSVSVPGCSVVSMDGGSERPKKSGESRDPGGPAGPGDSMMAARRAADAGAMAGDASLADLFARLDAALEDRAQARWGPCSPEEVRAALRSLAGRQSRFEAAGMRL